jgi:outer membrane protein
MTMGSIVFWLTGRQEKKIAVVDAVKLFETYNMKIELEDIAKAQLVAASRQLDSASNAMRMGKAINVDEERTKMLITSYNTMKAKLEKDYAQSNHDINEQVWKRLNPLLDEYGRKNGLHVIIGANGMGSVLYNDEFYDRTNDMIKFANKKYAEGN